jgi:hypothetical protein
MYNPPFAGKKGRLFSQEPQRGIPGGHPPSQLASRLLSQDSSRFTTQSSHRYLSQFLSRLASQFITESSSQCSFEDLCRFLHGFISRCFSGFLTRLASQNVSQCSSECSTQDPSRFLCRLVGRLVCQCLCQDLSQDSSTLFSPVFRPARIRPSAAGPRPACQCGPRLDKSLTRRLYSSLVKSGFRPSLSGALHRSVPVLAPVLAEMQPLWSSIASC